MYRNEFHLSQAGPADIGLTSRALLQVLLARGVSPKEATRIAVAHADEVGERTPGREAQYVALQVESTAEGSVGLTRSEQLQLFWLDLRSLLERQHAERTALRSTHRRLGAMAIVPGLDINGVQHEVMQRLRHEMAIFATHHFTCGPASIEVRMLLDAEFDCPLNAYSPAAEWRFLESRFGAHAPANHIIQESRNQARRAHPETGSGVDLTC